MYKILVDAIRVVKFGSDPLKDGADFSHLGPVAWIQRKNLSESDVGPGQMTGQEIPGDAGQNTGQQSRQGEGIKIPPTPFVEGGAGFPPF